MINLKSTICLLSVFQILVLGCNNRPDKQHLEDSLDSIKKDTVEIQSSGTNVIDEKTVSPYKEVDSLVRLLNRNFTFTSVRELDRICLRSDGDLSESLDVVAVNLLNDHFGYFSETGHSFRV
jgi:hypothetical protein